MLTQSDNKMAFLLLVKTIEFKPQSYALMPDFCELFKKRQDEKKIVKIPTKAIETCTINIKRHLLLGLYK